MYLPVEPGRLIERPVNRGPENRGCTVLQKPVETANDHFFEEFANIAGQGDWGVGRR